MFPACSNGCCLSYDLFVIEQLTIFCLASEYTQRKVLRRSERILPDNKPDRVGESLDLRTHHRPELFASLWPQGNCFLLKSLPRYFKKYLYRRETWIDLLQVLPWGWWQYTSLSSWLQKTFSSLFLTEVSRMLASAVEPVTLDTIIGVILHGEDAWR